MVIREILLRLVFCFAAWQVLRERIECVDTFQGERALNWKVEDDFLW